MLHLWVLLVVFLHHLQIHRVMYLETFGLNLLFPVLVVYLDVVENTRTRMFGFLSDSSSSTIDTI